MISSKQKQRLLTGGMIVLIVAILIVPVSGVCEGHTWDCPECGKTGNTFDYCGGCGHPAPWLETEPTPVSVSEIVQYSIVSFGKYEQDTDLNNGPEGIEWIVLSVQDNKCLLISRYGLDAKPYNTSYEETTWESSSIRQWLNDEFINNAFSQEERTAIVTASVQNDSAQGFEGWKPEGGKDTEDRIFLLSCAEAHTYLNVEFGVSNPGSRVALTAFSVQEGAWANAKMLTEEGKPAGFWWLRSPGYLQEHASFVNIDGSLNEDFVTTDYFTVRPALWLDLNAEVF